jgi:HD-GYP domain-containing protein (c-di-GMP phosphodiesterase class II)
VIEFRKLPKRNDQRHRKEGSATPKVSFAGTGQNPIGSTPGGQADHEEAKALYEQASRYLSAVFASVRKEEEFDPEIGFRIMRSMAEMQPFQDVLFLMAIHLDDRYNFMINHSVNVAVFALKMAVGLGFDIGEQVEIGTAALLHDVGTALIPDSIINKSGRLTDEEFKTFRERPKHSQHILLKLGEACGTLAEVAVQVYEKIDGSGYPQGLKGPEIHEYAQIIGLVDMYEALIHSRPQREKLLHFSAVKEIIKSSKNAFQHKHLKALLSIFSIFPIHSYVRLNSEAIGKVIETYPDQPLRPKLQITFDSQKRRVLTERIINLPENPLLYIVDSVSEEELDDLAELS